MHGLKINSPNGLLLKILHFKETGLVGVILVLGLILTIFGGNIDIYDNETDQVYQVNKFLRADNLDKLAKNTSFFAIMGIGVTFVIITGGIDLSVGSAYCLAAVCGAMFLNYFGPTGPGAGTPPGLVLPVGVLICAGFGLLCGILNGGMVVLLKVHPFIITLGTMAIFRGIAFVMTKAQSYTFFPPEFTDGFIRYEIGPNLYLVPMTIMILVMVLSVIYLKYMITGRQIFAVGGNEEAARFSGIRVSIIKLKVYALAGLMTGIAAMIMLGYYGSASSDAGRGYELDVIAAAVVGGASLSGGRGSALGALLGALIIQMINSGIIILQIDQNYSQIIIGVVIILAVVLDQFNAKMREKRMIKANIVKPNLIK